MTSAKFSFARACEAVKRAMNDLKKVQAEKSKWADAILKTRIALDRLSDK